MAEMNKIEKYYNKFNEEKRLDTRHGQMEYRLTMKYIHDMLERIITEKKVTHKKDLQILDIGAGTGRYSVPLCEEGYSVTAVELVKYNLGILKKKSDKVKALQGNALHLKKIEDSQFDLTLLFGPMYHLMKKEEKITALKEAKRVTKPGGYIMVAYIMNEYAFLTYAIAENHVRECLESGMLSDDFHTLPSEDSLYDFVRLEDISMFNAEAKLERIKIFSPDGPANYMRTFVNRLSVEDFEVLVKYQFATCERMDLMGAAAHTVDILKKAEK